MNRVGASSGDAISVELIDLEARIAREDLEDARVARMQRRAGLREPRRDVKCFQGFASNGVPRAKGDVTNGMD